MQLRRNETNESLGLSLSGNNNLSKSSGFICDIYPKSLAARHGGFRIGDQILEINDKVIYGRAHSNVTPIVKNLNDLVVNLVIFR